MKILDDVANINFIPRQKIYKLVVLGIIMKLKLKDLQPNPFRKEINGGKMDNEKVLQIASNFDETKLGGLANSLPVVQRGKNNFLVFGHTRVEALKKKFGNDYEVEITLQTYNDDQLFRGMLIENLTQRKGEFSEEEQSIGAIHRYLKKNQEILQGLRDSRKPSTDKNGRKNDCMNKKFDTEPTSRDISKWLDDNQGRVMSHDVITKYLNIHLNLDEGLKATVEKKHDNTKAEREDGETLNSSQAVYLATLKDKEEQKDIAKALLSSREQRVRTQGELFAKYKKADIKIKEKIRNGEKDLADLRLPNQNLNINLSREKLTMEMHIELRKSFDILKQFMDDFKKQNNDKNYLKKSTEQDLKLSYHYIHNWIKDDLIPFTKEIIQELANREQNKDVVVFDIIEN